MPFSTYTWDQINLNTILMHSAYKILYCVEQWIFEGKKVINQDEMLEQTN